jgi:hypothetical protein
VNRLNGSIAVRVVVGVASLCLGLSPAALAQDTTGVGGVRGAVSDTRQQSVRDVAICLEGTGQCTASDANGRFVLEGVRVGTYRLEVIPPNQPRFVSDPVEVRAGRETVVDVTLPVVEALTSSVTVTAPRFVVPDEIKTSGFVVGADEVLSGAGALQDVARFVQALPGVVIGTDDFRNDLIVRGGSPLENLFIVDNVEIPNINSFATFASAGGIVSMLDAQLIQDVTFLTGGYPAPYGNRASSVLQVAQREGNRQRAAGRATVGFAGAGFVAEGPLGAGRGSWVASMRRSFLDLFTDDLGFGGVPVLYSFNGKAVYDLSPRDRVWAVNVSGRDSIRLGLTEDSDLTEELSNLDIRYRGNRTATGVNWQRIFGTRGVGLFGVSVSRASVNQQAKDLIRGGVPPAGVPVDEQIANGTVVFREDSVERQVDVKYDLTLKLPSATTLQVGAAVKMFDADYDEASPFGTDSPYFPLDVNPFAIRTGLRTTQPGVYGQATRTIVPRLDATAGVRWDRYNYLGTASPRTSPRIGLRYRLTRALSLTGAAGRYYQQPFFLFLAAFPQNRTLPPFRADHLVGGVVLGDGSGDKVSIEVYRKTYHHYPVSADIGPLSLANIGDTFALRDILFPMTSDGRGTVRGLEALASRRRLPGRRWSGQANVSWSQARHAGIDGVPRPGSFDTPIVVNTIGTYTVSPAWDLSFKWTFLSGRPYTPVDAARAITERRAVYDLSRMNTLRLPDYQRLDVRIDRRFLVRGQPVSVFAGAQNVLNRQNVAAVGWDRRANELRTRYQQGIFPILGLDWTF